MEGDKRRALLSVHSSTVDAGAKWQTLSLSSLQPSYQLHNHITALQAAFFRTNKKHGNRCHSDP